MSRLLSLLLVVSLLGGCLDNTDSVVDGFQLPQDGPLAVLTDADFDALPPQQRFQVANKLLGTLYRGVSAKDFFDLGAGLDPLRVRFDQRGLPGQVRLALDTPLDDYPARYAELEERFFGSGRPGVQYRSYEKQVREHPLIHITQLPLSREQYIRWIAYQLVNTILFSPGWELETVDTVDVETVYNELVYAMEEGLPIAEIVYRHMISEENWRRFRSPEDNVREMMEIYLLRFRDDEVPKAARACRNWYLSDDAEGYQLKKSLDFNREPIPGLLDRNDIISCEDFYRALAYHPGLIPAVSRRVVDLMFPEKDARERTRLAQALAETNPTTFPELFSAVIFSRAYLLDNPHLRGFEAAFFNTAARLGWQPNARSFEWITRENADSSNLGTMKQAPMTYKLGRANRPPTDSMSMAHYHRFMRTYLLLDEKNPEREDDAGWRLSLFDDPVLDGLGEREFIDYLFLGVLGRRASDDEWRVLWNEVIEAEGWSGNRRAQTRVVLDYCSRLAELYAYPL